MATSGICKDGQHEECNGKVVMGAPGPFSLEKCKCKCHKENEQRGGWQVTQRNLSALLFAHIADAIRKVGDEHGCKVYVSTNSRSITIDRQRPGRGEYDLHVKVRGDGA